MAALGGKTIVIVGGTTGMGLSATLACAHAGANLVVVGKDAVPPETFAPDVAHQPPVLVVGDAQDPTTIDRAIAEALERWGRLDGLYHVAGGSGRSIGDGPLHEITDEGWDATLQLNLTSLFYSNRAAARQFLRQMTGGVVLNMGSVLVSSPAPAYFATHAYTAAKSAIVGFTRSCAAYYAPHDIRFNVIAPALVETPMSRRAAGNPAIRHFAETKQPLDGGRLGQPGDLDGAVVFLLSDAARIITGQVLCVDGGWSVSDGQVGGGEAT